MGCDIHMYVEYKDKSDSQRFWCSFGGRINPGRNYTLFGLLAGVRRGIAIFSPRGVPGDVSWAARSDVKLLITETGKEEGCCTLEDAQRWEKSGCKITKSNDGKFSWVDHPDWHSHSWLTLDEFEQVIQVHKHDLFETFYGQAEYEALLAAMKKLAEFDKDVRVVFWFDN